MPERLKLCRAQGWRLPPGARSVARPTRWGNPFRVWLGHHLIGPPWNVARESWGHVPKDACTAGYITSSEPIPIAVAVDKYRDLLTVRARDEPYRLRAWLEPLVGLDLACWCPLDQPCHADVLLELVSKEAHRDA